MKQLWRVAFDLLLEAVRRKWFVALFGAISAALLVLALFFQLDVIDGAVAGSKLFGALIFDGVISTGQVLGNFYKAAAFVGFYVGAFFLCIACSDFAPELLAPGRIEHLLSLPLSRWQLLFGTYLGVILIAALGLLYGSLGLTLIMGIKTGLWNARLFWASGINWIGFCALYALMLTMTLFVRSAALSGAAGIAALILGVIASYRETLAIAMEGRWSRELFSWAMLPIPRFAGLAQMAGRVAASQDLDSDILMRLLGGCGFFAFALLAVAAFRFENKDF
jgi:ABC-type transport system involved in multi-copper enzyme maturation permease subunit